MSGGAIHGNLDCFGVTAKVEQLQSQLSQVQGERDSLHRENERLNQIQAYRDEAYKTLWEEFKRSGAERDSFKKEVERLSGKTGFCTQCERYAKEVQRLRGALGFIHKYIDRNSMINVECFEKAKQALSSNEGRPIETLFSGQCNHHIPIGQPCKACNR